MALIEEFNVIQPPTSLEVKMAAFGALRNSEVLPLILMPKREVPRPTPVAVEVVIRQTIHSDVGDMVISGSTGPDRGSIIIRTTDSDQLPATASWVTHRGLGSSS